MAYPRANWRIKGRMPTAPGVRAAIRTGYAPPVSGGASQAGTWKLAYADFLTALAAFFLVMWLVKGVPEDGRAEIADYFVTGEAEAETAALAAADRPDARGLLLDALARAPAIQSHGPAISLSLVADGVRIDLMDRSGHPLFEIGSATPTAHGLEVMGEVFLSMAALPYPITLEGHTDAFPFRGTGEAGRGSGGGSNWSLSADRADQARQIAEDSQIAPTRFQAITGFGDRRPRLPAEPHHPSNRRVTVILHVPPNDRMDLGI